MGEKFRYRCEIDVPFPSEKLANDAKKVLEVDQVLQPDKSTRVIRIEGRVVKVTLGATEPKMLRAMANSFYDVATVVVRTMQEFAEKD
mmetsp:Transcript_1016/g.1641  ORF Transcript_1016/g.1641 Transcript_1016/m.1641 type:complete len:88 (+) Transcript_1016:164-427(+)